MAELSERRPGRDWDEVPFPPQAAHECGHVAGSAWIFGHVAVISALVNAELPDGSGEVGPQWHISITRKRKRPKDTDVRRALRAFRMVGAEEDNHHPGNARHFWLPVDPARRVDCECKAEEVTVVEADGYRYTNPHDPAECRGCEIEWLIGRPCPLHSSEDVPAQRRRVYRASEVTLTIGGHTFAGIDDAEADPQVPPLEDLGARA